MSEQESTLNEFTDSDILESGKKWESVKLEDIARKRSNNVDPEEVAIDRHIGLEHIQPNTPTPDWEPVDDLSSTKRRFEAGDILFAKLRPNLEKSAQPDFEGIASTDIFPIVATEGINSKYLLYQLSSKPAYDHARRTSVGTRMPRTSWNLFSNYEFQLPSVEEQHKIATVLYTVDQAIQKTEEIREKAKSVEEVAKTEFFTHGYSEWDVQESVEWRCRANQVPKDWDVKTADELMEITRGASPRPRSDDSLFGGNIPWIKIGDANRDESKRIEEVNSYVTEKGKNRSKFVEEGTLLVANSGATCGFSIFAGVDGCVHDGWLILRGYDDFSPDFLYHYINWNYDYLQSLSLGSAQTNLSTSLFGRLDIPVPALQEQQQIVNALDSISEVVAHASTEINRLQRLKRGLMQDLLSGEIRTHDKDIDILDDVLQHG
ncbi:hypothetical protein BRD02_01860 [Halobacteriales archaeon QS_8_69_73]|nr:MAG: hypothetical protein BRD02_01860 [Halobacteriales archaeon QS_8_69_73]